MIGIVSSPIDGFEYRYKEATGEFGDDWTEIAHSGSDLTWHTVSGLVNGTLYVFEVRAVSARFPGEPRSVQATPSAVGAVLQLRLGPGSPGRGRQRIQAGGRPVPRHGAGSRARLGEPGRARRGRTRRDRVWRPGRSMSGPNLRPVRHRRVRVRLRRFGFPTETRKWRSAWAPDTERMAGTRRPAWI